MFEIISACLQLIVVSHFCTERRIRQVDDVFAAWRGREAINIVVVIERGQHTRHSRRWGLAQAEGLRDGYRHSFIVVIEMCALSPVHSSLLWSNCVLQRAAASLCDDGLMAPKMLRLRSSSQMRKVNTHGAAGGGVWPRPSVCVGYRYSVPSGAQTPGITS